MKCLLNREGLLRLVYNLDLLYTTPDLKGGQHILVLSRAHRLFILKYFDFVVAKLLLDFYLIYDILEEHKSLLQKR